MNWQRWNATSQIFELSLDSGVTFKPLPLRPPINVKHFGAIGDGVTDDTTAIASAFTAAGGTIPIFFPGGTYKDTGSHSLGNGQIVYGEGPLLSIISSRHATLPWLLIDSTYNQVRDLSINGNGPTNGFIAIKIIDSSGVAPSRYIGIKNVHVSGFTSHGIYLHGVWKCHLEGVRSISNSGNGILVDDSTSIPSHLNFKDCWFESNTLNGVKVTSATIALGILFDNVINILNTISDYDLTNVFDCNFYGSYSAQSTGGVGVKCSGCTNISFVGGGFHNYTTAIELTNCTGVSVSGLYFDSNTQSIYVKTGSSGSSQCNYFGAGITIKTDAGALFWSDLKSTNKYGGGVTVYSDTADVISNLSPEKGVWTPNDASGAGLAFTFPFQAEYLKVGRSVFVNACVLYPATASGVRAIIGGLPFPPLNNQYGMAIAYTDVGSFITLLVEGNLGSQVGIWTTSSVSNATMSGKSIRFSGHYRCGNS